MIIISSVACDMFSNSFKGTRGYSVVRLIYSEIISWIVELYCSFKTKGFQFNTVDNVHV